MIFFKPFMRIGFFNLLPTILLFLIMLPKYSYQEIQLAQCREIWGGYDTSSTDPTINTISRQLDFYQTLGYTHVSYPFSSVNHRRVRCKEDGSWTWLNNRDQRYINFFCSIYDSIKFHNMEVVPCLFPHISHSGSLIRMIPQMSAIPPVSKILYLKTCSKREDDLNFSIKIHKPRGTCVYIAYDTRISQRPTWLRDNFERLNTTTQRDSPDADDDEIVRMMVLCNNGDTIRYDLYQSDSINAYADSVKLGRSGYHREKYNYLVLFGPYNYSPIVDSSAGFIHPDSIRIEISNASDESNYRLDTIQYNSSEFEFLHGDSSNDYKLIKGQNNSDISGILSFNPYIRSLISDSILDSTCTAINNPVRYNDVLKVNTNNTSFSNIRIYNLYALYLGLLKNSYQEIYNKYVGNTDVDSFPRIIGLGHDELGYDRQCFVYPTDGKTVAQIIAQEIKMRIHQIDSVFGESNQIKVLIFGDSFVKNDYGQGYNMIGDTSLPDNLYGRGGVLWILKNEYNLEDRIIVLPWRYSHKDGYDAFHASKKGGEIVLDKCEQARYLDKLGINFIPCMGEDHGRGEIDINDYLQCSWEWMRAGEAFPKHRVGYAHLNYGTWAESNTGEKFDGVTFGQLNSIIPYLQKYSYLVKTFDGNKPEYNSVLLSGLDHKKARDSISWVNGVHYTLGFGLADLGNSKFIHGGWNDSLTNYAINGNDSGNGLCFAYTVGRNFEFITKVNNRGNSDYSGILIRNNLSKELNQSPYVHLFYSSNSNRVYIEYCDSSGYTARDATYASGQNLFLKVQKYGKNLKLYYSDDGIQYTLLKIYTVNPSDVFVGLATRDSRTDFHEVNVTFSNISFKPYDQQPVVNLMLNNF